MKRNIVRVGPYDIWIVNGRAYNLGKRPPTGDPCEVVVRPDCVIVRKKGSKWEPK